MKEGKPQEVWDILTEQCIHFLSLKLRAVVRGEGATSSLAPSPSLLTAACIIIIIKFKLAH